MKESALRDLIAQNIHKLKAGLQLLQKEQYIPNKHGTKSFIDLYAKDENGRHVLIELKRSAAASRQAIHEVTKYVEGVKRFFGAKDYEVHVIIASTDWSELLLPFSRFCSDSSFSVEGIKINLLDCDTDFEVESIIPLTITQGRFIAPWHHVYWYKDEIALQRGIDGIEKAYKEKGISDYIIVKLYTPDGSAPEERRYAILKAVASLMNVEKTERSDGLSSSIPTYEYIAYTALQMVPKGKCLEIISHDPDVLSEVQELLPDMEEDEALCYLHENIELVQPSPHCDCYEIGYPAKFSKLIETCEQCGIVRHGIFQLNTLLCDDILYAELEGEDGSTGQKLKRTLDMTNSAHIKNLKEDVEKALRNNPVWTAHILREIDEIKKDFPESQIDISVFNPCTGIFTIYYTMIKEQGLRYLPSYTIAVRAPEEVRIYYGALEAIESEMDFQQILEKYYEGDLFALLATATWGGRDERDSDIIEDLGAQYRSYRIDICEGQIVDSFTFRDDKWRTYPLCSFWRLFQSYIEKHQSLVKEILLKISDYDQGTFFTNASDVHESLDVYMNMEEANKRSIYFGGAPDRCDICQIPFADEEFLIDGEVGQNGPWAFMCRKCFLKCGGRIAWGHGQLYRKNTQGWLLVGGFCPESELE